MDKWKIWIDTGGTFTDCIAVAPGGIKNRLKVLSSGSLRGNIIKQVNATTFEISQNWGVSEDIFKGYEFRLLNTLYEGIYIDEFQIEKSVLKVNKPINYEGISGAFEITAHEEAPILAMRLATERSLDVPLPPMDIRLGSTKGTNALLENKGEAPVLITTKGFADLSIIGTQQRDKLFSLSISKAHALFCKVIEVDERIDAEGKVLNELKESAINRVLREVYNSGKRVVAIALLNSYKNPLHERNLFYILKTAGYKYICASYQLEQSINFLARTETTLVNAYLMPVISEYISNIQSKLTEESTLKIMTSSGGLVDSKNFFPKDSLLSGPAGGVCGAAITTVKHDMEQVISFDMGGTSTDVSRYSGSYDYIYQTRVGNYRIMSPSLYIETVAAGGGSICSYDGYRLKVGPESAGANPGPACYGNGGPLTVTDVNLLLGRIDESCFGIPIDIHAANLRLMELLSYPSLGNITKERVLKGFIEIADEKMAKAIERISIQKGFDPKTHALLAFGGAGGMHACNVARTLQMSTIIVPYDAGILSAYGIGRAGIERIITRQVLKPVDGFLPKLPNIIAEMKEEARELLRSDHVPVNSISEIRVILMLRFKGQDNSLEIPFECITQVKRQFKKKYTGIYGHYIDKRDLELESIRLLMGSGSMLETPEKEVGAQHTPNAKMVKKSYQGGIWVDTPVFVSDTLVAGASIHGPAIISNNTSTTYIETGWEARITCSGDIIVKQVLAEKNVMEVQKPQQVQMELFTNRFRSVVEDMGAMLARTAFSVNIKERLDFSCALLDSKGFLVVNAPHIPVHLGALGLCVRSVLELYSLNEGDIIVTNHPAFGGSHLPDVTLVAPIYFSGECIGYLANRAHHAEIGGISPGSMPADANNLVEEGVVIHPVYIARNGIVNIKEITEILTSAQYPTRSVEENIADLRAGIASIRYGLEKFTTMCEVYGVKMVVKNMAHLHRYAANCLANQFASLPQCTFTASEKLDDASMLCVEITPDTEKLKISFVGTSAQHTGNMNATPAIVYSTVLYVLRLLIDEDIPLNEGFLEHISIDIPAASLLNPKFSSDPAHSPAVVGGNVEVSQRLTDTLLKAFGLAACSQGTMNNLLFGNEKFGFYETICGGVGAVEGAQGASAVHQHMTNTRITDVEIMESRYPVRVEKFCLRKGSGGQGKFKGGDGVERQIQFLASVKLTVLSQHRIEKPYGMHGGEAGAVGEQYLCSPGKNYVPIDGMTTVDVKAGESILIKTPGGGGWGQP